MDRVSCLGGWWAGFSGVALTTQTHSLRPSVESTSHFQRRPQIPCRVFADPPGRRGGGGIGSSAVHIRSRSARLSIHDFTAHLTGEAGPRWEGELASFFLHTSCWFGPGPLFVALFLRAAPCRSDQLGLWSARRGVGRASSS